MGRETWYVLIESFAIVIGIIMIVSFVIKGNRKSRERYWQVVLERNERIRDQDKAKKEQDKAKKEQIELRKHAAWLVSTSVELRKSTFFLSSNADAALDRAEDEFAERAFAPFWDAVESAVNDLAQIDGAIRSIGENCISYRTDVEKLDSPPAAFDIETASLPSVPGTAERMHKIVRQAQKDFQFSTIFEQRKTNQLLVLGFGTLASAIAEMGSRIKMSLYELDLALSSSADMARESSAQIVGRLDSVLDQERSEAQAKRKHEAEEREMLKEIGRKLGPH